MRGHLAASLDRPNPPGVTWCPRPATGFPNRRGTDRSSFCHDFATAMTTVRWEAQNMLLWERRRESLDVRATCDRGYRGSRPPQPRDQSLHRSNKRRYFQYAVRSTQYAEIQETTRVWGTWPRRGSQFPATEWKKLAGGRQLNRRVARVPHALLTAGIGYATPSDHGQAALQHHRLYTISPWVCRRGPPL